MEVNNTKFEGCGAPHRRRDCVTGVMVAALVAGDSLVDAFAKGLAAATASCKGMQGAVYSQAAFEALQKGSRSKICEKPETCGVQSTKMESRRLLLRIQ